MNLSTPISELGFSTRTERLLRRTHVMTLDALAEETDGTLLEIRGFGAGCLKEVKDKLKENGLHLGMKDSPILSGMRQCERERRQAAMPIEEVARLDLGTSREPEPAITTFSMQQAEAKEECTACDCARTNGSDLECHCSDPQVFFRQLGSGEIQHTGYWPTVASNGWCGEFKVNHGATKN